MDVRFRYDSLEECFKDESLAYREWGRNIGRRYLRRIVLLQQTDLFETLYEMNGLRLHALQGNLAGFYAIDLNDQWRLMVSREGENTVIVEEVSNHYGD